MEELYVGQEEVERRRRELLALRSSAQPDPVLEDKSLLEKIQAEVENLTSITPTVSSVTNPMIWFKVCIQNVKLSQEHQIEWRKMIHYFGNQEHSGNIGEFFGRSTASH